MTVTFAGQEAPSACMLIRILDRPLRLANGRSDVNDSDLVIRQSAPDRHSGFLASGEFSTRQIGVAATCYDQRDPTFIPTHDDDNV